MYDSDFDRQKLMYHPESVAVWMKSGRTPGPVYTEMELTTCCDHACSFCAVSHIVNRRRDFINSASACRVIGELVSLGNKSIMFSGHGESLLHPEAPRIVAFASERMSASLNTNGALLDGERLHMIDGLEWVRFSVNGCDPENYAAIHGTIPRTFLKVMDNIESAVKRKIAQGLSLTIGAQLVLLEENAASVAGLARRLKDLGVDYFSVKPYSRHPMNDRGIRVDYDRHLHLEEELKSMEEDSFRIVFRARAMANAGKKKSYGKCYGTHFLNFISANGGVWECNVFAEDPRFRIGDIRENSMEEIWNGPRRAAVLDFIENGMNLGECRDNCRMSDCNRYLWRLRNPLEHDNFI